MSHSLLVKNAKFNGELTDILIRDGIFSAIAPSIECDDVPLLEAHGKIAVPAFYNGHTHHPMAFLRGFADDKRLEDWLNNYIWPREAKLTKKDIEDGTRLAISEMIRSGTVFFNDTYWMAEATLRVADEMGVRACIGRFVITNAFENLNTYGALEKAYEEAKNRHLLMLSYAPHAVYTVSGEILSSLAVKAKNDNSFFHIHASETRQEVEDCIKAHGLTPIAWLEKCGVLSERTILAHCVHLTAEDIEIIKRHNSVICHNPCSNYKLCSGQFNFKATYEEAGLRVILGTDGCASNNNLSMFDEMKLAALNAKMQSGDPTCGKAADIWKIATRGGAEAFGINGGKIEVGAVGDMLLLDNTSTFLTPEYHLDANIVYSADTSVVDTTICDGRVLMEGRKLLV